MDASTLVVLLLVASGDRGDPATTTMAETAAEALSGRAEVVTRDAGEDPVTDATAQRLARSLHADAVVVVSWSRPGGDRASVHIATNGEAGWVDRQLAFRREDPGAERGRMLGFEIAAMVHAPAPPPGPPPSSPPAPPPPSERPAATVARPLHRWSLDVTAIGAAALGGSGGGLGGGASGRFWVSEVAALRAGAGLRVADASALQATLTTVRLEAGMATNVVEVAGWATGLRVDLVALRHAASSTENDSRGAHWLAGCDAALEEAVRIAPRAQLVLGGGVELAFGTTRLLLGSDQVGTIPPFRVFVEIGVRVSF